MFYIAQHHGGNNPFNILIPREDVFSDLKDSYLEIETQIVKNAIQPNNLFGMSLFREMSLSSFGSKKLETIDHVYLASLMLKLLPDNEEDMMIIYKNQTTGTIDNVKRNRILNDNAEKGTIFTRVYLNMCLDS